MRGAQRAAKCMTTEPPWPPEMWRAAFSLLAGPSAVRCLSLRFQDTGLLLPHTRPTLVCIIFCFRWKLHKKTCVDAIGCDVGIATLGQDSGFGTVRGCQSWLASFLGGQGLQVSVALTFLQPGPKRPDTQRTPFSLVGRPRAALPRRGGSSRLVRVLHPVVTLSTRVY